MANVIDVNGIHIDDLNTTLEELKTEFKSIYGQEVNLDQNSPDGQLLNIIAQAKQDLLEFAVSIYNGMDVDTVVGDQQDILYKLNGLIRKSSEYSYVEVAVTTNAPCNLNGLDKNVLSPTAVGYTVSDNNGNNWYLVDSVSLKGNTTTILNFRAALAGALECLPNTITVMSTVVAGVASVNNPSKQYLTGASEESYSAFRTRRNRAMAISSTGFEDGLKAQLENISTVSAAYVYQNRGDVVDSKGVPPHSIWCIVEGGTDDEIGQIIYSNLTDGCGMKGETVVYVTKSNGSLEEVRYDKPKFENLYIKANLQNLNQSALDLDYIKTQLVTELGFDIYGAADSSNITTIMKSIVVENAVPFDVQVSLDGNNWQEYLLPSSVQNKFTVTTENITLTVV